MSLIKATLFLAISQFTDSALNLSHSGYTEIPIQITVEDRPAYDRVIITIKNTTSRAICIPWHLTLFGNAKLRSRDFLEVTEVENNQRLETTGRKLHSPDVLDSFFMIPPQGQGIMSDSIEDFFNLIPGKHYNLRYNQQVFFCDSFNDGYPQKLRRSTYYDTKKIPYFKRSPKNTLWLNGDVLFRHK